MSFNECLNRIKSKKALKYDYQVAELLGLTKSALAERKSRNSLPLDKISIFCEQNNINTRWILTGEGEQDKANVSGPTPPGCAFVDVFSLAGPDETRRLTGSRIFKGMAVPHGFATDGIEAILLQGDSMEPCVYDGAILGIDRADINIVNGSLYAAWLDREGAVIRRAFVEAERIVLKSENNRRSPVILEERIMADGLILGRVKWLIQKF